MATFLFATFTASLIGSIHCVGMCGPFVLMATGTTRRWPRLAAYHTGRLFGYAGLGAVAGSAGAALDMSGEVFGLQRIAAIAAGVALIAFGLFALVRSFGGRLPHVTVPGAFHRFLQTAHRATRELPAGVRAGAIGALSAFLPCGWLFLFALTAAGTGSLTTGTLVMVAFWLGTLPLLTAFAAGLTKLSGRARAVLPIATALLCLVAGGHTLFVRANADIVSLRDHFPATDSIGVDEAGHVRHLTDKPLPCCHGR